MDAYPSVVLDKYVIYVYIMPRFNVGMMTHSLWTSSHALSECSGMGQALLSQLSALALKPSGLSEPLSPGAPQDCLSDSHF
jgi:hypothetical protein